VTVDDDLSMKKFLLVYLLICSMSWCVTAGAQTRNVSSSQSREERNLERKQMKAQKKDAKARRKAERRMEKYDRKHTHDPNLPRR
jgi:Ni/Co efflux regulator RcnB